MSVFQPKKRITKNISSFGKFPEVLTTYIRVIIQSRNDEAQVSHEQRDLHVHLEQGLRGSLVIEVELVNSGIST